MLGAMGLALFGSARERAKVPLCSTTRRAGNQCALPLHASAVHLCCWAWTSSTCGASHCTGAHRRRTSVWAPQAAGPHANCRVRIQHRSPQQTVGNLHHGGARAGGSGSTRDVAAAERPARYGRARWYSSGGVLNTAAPARGSRQPASPASPVRESVLRALSRGVRLNSARHAWGSLSVPASPVPACALPVSPAPPAKSSSVLHCSDCVRTSTACAAVGSASLST